MLNDYLQEMQRLLRDERQANYNPSDLVAYINKARRMVAYRAECIRVLTPISNGIAAWSVTAAGSGYSASPTLTISPPDFPSGRLPFPNGDQATASAVIQSGSIAAIFSQYGGSGYFQPTMAITDATGTGATAVAEMAYMNTLNQGQEVYPLSGIDLSANPGCSSVYGMLGIAIIYSNYRYSLPIYDFQTYQAKIRQYPFQYQYVPTFASQYQQGDFGDYYVYPLPSQTYQMEMDCLCVPLDLVNDYSYEAIPNPWRDAVPTYAMHLAFMAAEKFNAAQFYLKLFQDHMPRYSGAARPWRTSNPYGRY